MRGLHRRDRLPPGGSRRAVATCGTALTEDHVKLLTRFANRVVLAFDADAAGQGAAERFYEWEQRYRVQMSRRRPARRASTPPTWPPRPRWARRAVADASPFLAFRLGRVMGGQPARRRRAGRGRRAGDGASSTSTRPARARAVRRPAGGSRSSCRVADLVPRSPSSAAADRATRGRALPRRTVGRAVHAGSWPSPCWPRPGSRSPSGWSRRCSPTTSTGGRSGAGRAGALGAPSTPPPRGAELLSGPPSPTWRRPRRPRRASCRRRPCVASWPSGGRVGDNELIRDDGRGPPASSRADYERRGAAAAGRRVVKLAARRWRNASNGGRRRLALRAAGQPVARRRPGRFLLVGVIHAVVDIEESPGTPAGKRPRRAGDPRCATSS